MLYDRDIREVKVKDGKVFIEYNGQVEEVIFTREDLMLLLREIDNHATCNYLNIYTDKEILSGEQ